MRICQRWNWQREQVRHRLEGRKVADLGDDDAAEGIGYAGVYADEVELECRGAERVELHAELLPEVVEVPRVRLAGVVAGEIRRRGLQTGERYVSMSSNVRVSGMVSGSRD